MRISVLLSLLSGILYVFSFAPWDQAWLQWVCFVPLYFALDFIPASKRTPVYRFLIGMIPSIVICAGGFYWMIYATEQYGGLPFSAALVVFILFCLTGQLQIPLFLILRSKLSRGQLPNRSFLVLGLVLGLLYAGVESLYPKLFLDTAGHAFYHSPWVRQLADIGGPFILTVMVILVNELIYQSFKLRTLKPVLYAGLTGGLICSYGVWRTTQYQRIKMVHSNQSLIHLALIQANIGDYLKVAAEQGALEATDAVMNQYLKLSTEALQFDPKPDALVWPETAYPAIFQKPKTLLENRLEYRLHDFLNPFSGSLLFGGYDSDDAHLEYNSLYFYHSPSRKKEVYHKSILLMFGETLPFAEAFPSVKSWFPTMGFFGRGPGAELKTVINGKGESFRIAPSICYEGLFTDHSVNGALLGADALLNITNDSWFGPLGEPYLHLALTQFRSIETRLPLLRATNTGISVAIDPLGETLGSTRIMKEDVLHASVPHREMAESPYLFMARSFGPNWFVRLCQSILIAYLVQITAMHFLRRKPKPDTSL
jgi:apolipoprotein N-acyltransferase